MIFLRDMPTVQSTRKSTLKNLLPPRARAGGGGMIYASLTPCSTMIAVGIDPC